MKNYYGFTKEESDIALEQFYKAIEFDSDFSAALAWAAVAYTKRRQNNWMNVPDREVSEAVRLARRAAELGKDDALALSCSGFALAFLNGELEAGLALERYPNGLNRGIPESVEV
jgi:hypothetical protein